MSLTPLSLQNAFAVIQKSRVPDQSKRGRLFEAAMSQLTNWWCDNFFEVISTGHIRNKTFEVVQELIRNGDGMEDVEADEIIRSSKSLMKHALMKCGSRDVSAQLFTALCRALGIPARLVVSLQSVPWQSRLGKTKASGTRKKEEVNGTVDDLTMDKNSDDAEDIDFPRLSAAAKGKGKATEESFVGDGYRLDGMSTHSTDHKSETSTAPIIKLRKSKRRGQKLGSRSSPALQTGALSYILYPLKVVNTL
jgi:xeroderma pigmentosum group C-complementing protein